MRIFHIDHGFCTKKHNPTGDSQQAKSFWETSEFETLMLLVQKESYGKSRHSRTEILLPDNLQKHTKTTLFKTNGELNTPSSTCFLQKAEFFSMKVSRKKSIIHLGWRLFTHSFTSTTPKLFFAYFVVSAPNPPPPSPGKKTIYIYITYITLVLPWK